MRILHLSDLHISSDMDLDMRLFIINPLIEDLKAFHDKTKIDIVAITGDLVYKGGEGFNSISEGFKCFEKNIIDVISHELNIAKDRFFFIPGNHDIIRSEDSDISEVGMKGTMVNTDEVNKYIDTAQIEGMKRVLAFKQFEKQYNELYRSKAEESNFESFYSLDIDGVKVGVSCFNTVWRCSGPNDKGNLLIGERQVSRVTEKNHNCDINIALMHHNLEWLADFDRKSVQPFLFKSHDLILSGHSHDTSADLIQGVYGQYYQSVAPANWDYNIRGDSIEWANGYSILDLDENKNLNIHFRRYSHKMHKYVANNDFGDENGIIKFKFSSTDELTKKQRSLKILENIKDVYFDELNQHLINFDEKNDLSKTIKDLFVMPEISRYREDFEKTDKVKKFTIDLNFLCSQESNTLLIGTKESGKTILLDRILIEYVEKYELYGKIPVYYNVNDYNNGQIENVIKRFLGYGQIEDLLLEGKVVLLLDNISFIDQSHRFLKKLTKFLRNYPGVKVITTCITLDEDILPSEVINSDCFNLFNVYSIRQFRSKEMKELILKWFDDAAQFDSIEKFDKIHQLFINLSIPRTPFNISMFLSILEKQGNYKPINNATLLENYIEGLFEKLAEEEIYSDIFDYRNKERLLADIAYKMYLEKNSNYSIEQDKLISHIKQYLNNRQFPFDEVSVLKIFIDKGILIVNKINNISYVSFKFACFFKYFLMKTMDYNTSFKDEVLKEENFLHFMDEIEYYTGIKRDQTKILSICINTMVKEYEILNNKISDLGGYDLFFETRLALSDRIDNEILDNLQQEGKISEEKLNQVSDSRLQQIDCNQAIDKKEGDLMIFDKLHRLWSLSAKVLKNTEEVTEANLKTESFEKLLVCSMSFCCLYKVIINTYLSLSEEEEEEANDKIKALNMLLPLVHQMALSNDVATAKLSIVIKERYMKVKDRETTSDFEKFILLFLYADIKGNGYTSLLEQYIKSIKQNYIKDMSMYKLLKYYKFNRNTTIEDQTYLNLMRNLPTRSKQGRDAWLQEIKREKLIHEVDQLIG